MVNENKNSGVIYFDTERSAELFQETEILHEAMVDLDAVSQKSRGFLLVEMPV